jgi:acetyl-CoA carboxylase biotin carboxyl carrier protein
MLPPLFCRQQLINASRPAHTGDGCHVGESHKMARNSDTDAPQESFDLERLRKLFAMMDKFGVTEVNLQNEAEAWRIRRGPRQVMMPTAAVAPTAVAAQSEASSAATSAPQTAPAAAEKPAGITINAPTVGTFYNRPTPDDEPFVGVGSVVKPDTVVCLIEAMKVFNQIVAEKSGRIVEVLVENGDAVEFGQPLFRIEPA